MTRSPTYSSTGTHPLSVKIGGPGSAPTTSPKRRSGIGEKKGSNKNRKKKLSILGTVGRASPSFSSSSARRARPGATSRSGGLSPQEKDRRHYSKEWDDQRNNSGSASKDRDSLNERKDKRESSSTALLLEQKKLAFKVKPKPTTGDKTPSGNPNEPLCYYLTLS